MVFLCYTLELNWIMKDCIFFQLQKGYLYSDLYFGVNWALLLDLSFFCLFFCCSASDWTFLKEILWQASHTRALFPIKKPFCRGSSGSHASKYIHFHRKCFVLEVQCFLGLLCSHSAQVGFLSYVRWTPAPPPHPHTHSVLANTNKTRAPLTSPGPCMNLSSAQGLQQNQQNKDEFSALWRRQSERVSPRCICCQQANKQDAEPHQPTGGTWSVIVWEEYSRCL